MGLQDNGEGKIEPDGKTYTIYGGDGFFTAVDPDNADIAYEEYTGGDISVDRPTAARRGPTSSRRT